MTTTMKILLMNEVGLCDVVATQLQTIHGIYLLNTFQSFFIKDIDDICSNVRKPGGMIEHPDSTRTTPLSDLVNPGVTNNRFTTKCTLDIRPKKKSVKSHPKFTKKSLKP